MKRYLITLTLAAVMPLAATVEGAHALSASEIIEASEKAVRGDSQQGTFVMTVKTRRWTRSMTLHSWENRLQKKSFAEIISPPKDAGNRFLLMDKNMWHYIPRLQQTVKISASMMLQSWMGSDFSNDDIIKESSIKTDYFHKILGSETVDGHRCYKIELSPRPEAAVVWGKIVYYAREGDYLPVREDFYNEHGVLKKLLSCSSFKTMHDRVIPTVYRMQTVGKKDQYTLMEIRDMRFDVNIPARVFSLQNLQRK